MMKRLRKILILTIILIHVVDSLGHSIPKISQSKALCLQVPNTFTTKQVEFELGSIIAMALKGYDYPLINTFLDEAIRSQKDKKGILRLTNLKRIKGDPITLTIEFLQGKYQNERIKLKIECANLEEWYEKPEAITIDEEGKNTGLPQILKTYLTTIDSRKKVNKEDTDSVKHEERAEHYVYVEKKPGTGGGLFGEWIEAKNQKFLYKLIGKYLNEWILVKTKLGTGGSFRFYGVNYWNEIKGYAEGEDIVVLAKGNLPVTVFDAKGNKLEKHRVWINARINEKGVREGGAPIGIAYGKKKLDELIQKNFDKEIIVESELYDDGGFYFYRKKYWNKTAGYEGAKITVLSKQGIPLKVYAKSMISYGEAHLLGKYNKKTNKLEKVKVSNSKERKGFTEVLTKDSTVRKINDENIFEQNEFQCEFRNIIALALMGYKSFLINALLDERVYRGANKIGCLRVIKVEHSEKDSVNIDVELIKSDYESAVFTITLLCKNLNELYGGIGSIKIEKIEGQTDETTDELIRELNDQFLGIVLRNMQQVRNEENNETKTIKITDKSWESEDVEKLLEIFGMNATNRLLFSFVDCFPPKALLNSRFGYANTLAGIKRRKHFFDKKTVIDPKDLVETLGAIQILQDMRTRTDLEKFTDELIRVIYSCIVKQHNFLDQLEKEIKTTKVSDFVKTGINNAINYYRQFENFSPKGFRKATAAALKYYQKIGIQFILKKRKCILADEPGLGKTVQALGASVNAYDGKGAEKVLIVCPRVAREYVWQKQIKEHLSGDQKVFVIKTRKDLDDPRKMDKAKKARFIICSLEVIRGRSPRKSNKPDKRKKKIEETARKLREKINSLGIDFVILDEAHRIRNNSAGAKAMKDFDPDYKVLVTGTPQVGREPGKLFNLLNWMNRKKFPDKDDFKNKFLDGDDFSHLRDELKEHMIRRHFCDIASDLPKLNMEVKTLAMSKEQADFYKTVKNNIDKDPFIEKNKNSLFRKFMLNRAAVDTALIPKIEFTCTTTGKRIKYVPGYSHIDFGEVKYKIEMSRQKRGKILLKTKKTIITVGDDDKIKVKDNIYHVSIKQRKSFSAKYQALDAIIGDVVKKKKRKIVVFTGIVDVVKDLDKKYRLEGYKVKSIYGGILKERDQMIKDFNASTEPEILICTYQTLGECINLTGASDAVLIDQPWLVQERDQIVRRLYRLGQKRQVNFYALESSETEDRRREEALMEGDMLQKLLLDDPEAKDKKGIIKKFLATSGKIDEKLLENKLKSLYEEEKDKKKKPDIEEAKLFNEMYEKDLNIQFKNHSFKAILKTTSDGMVEINSIPELLVNAHMLSEASKEFLKRFFIKRLTFEEKQHFKPKDMMVWHICAEMIPGFRDVDYNARIELVIRIGTYILQRIIERPEDKDIAKKLGSDARDMFDETMYYLENAKILKLFSFIGIIPQTYYYKGALVRYVPPLKMYYAQNGIFYYDEQRAELISPNWRVPDENIPDHITGFDRDVLRVRKLTLEEEKGHARELAMFNKTSEEVLVGATLRKIKPIVGAVKKKLKKRFKASFVNAIEMKEFWDIGRNILVDLINKYAELEVYEHETLQEYVFNDRLFMRIYFWARNVRMKELETESQKGSLTIRDDSARGSLGLEEKDGINVLKQLLLKNNFSTKEVAIVENYLYGGETAETLAESTQLNQAEDKFTSEDAKETIKKFHKFMDLLGEKQTRQILEKGLSYPDTSSSDETLSTIELTKSFEDIEMQKLERRIDSIDCRSNEVLAVAGQIDLEKDEKKKYLINFVIDIDLFCAENIHLEKDIDILVKLILKYKDKKNINFIFEKFKFNKQKRRVPFAAKKESFEKGIFDKHQIADLVKEKLTRDKNFNGQDINCMELISDRIRTERLPNINIQNLEIVEVPLITGKKAHRARNNNEELAKNQYPVILGAVATNYSGEFVLKNYEAAFAFGMGKAALVIAKKRALQGIKGSEKEYEDLRNNIIMKFNRLYAIVWDNDPPVLFNERHLEYMIDESSLHRLSRALDFYLPPITALPGQKMEHIHAFICAV